MQVTLGVNKTTFKGTIFLLSCRFFYGSQLELEFERIATLSIPKRLTGAFVEHGMTVVKRPVTQL